MLPEPVIATNSLLTRKDHNAERILAARRAHQTIADAAMQGLSNAGIILKEATLVAMAGGRSRPRQARKIT